MIPTAVGRLSVRVEGDGPTAVLWHSLYVDDRSWDRVSAGLSAHRRLVRITGPGHGASERPAAPFTLADCAAAAAEVLAAVGEHGAVDWLGNAWGGHVGVVFAAEHPGRVRTLASFNAPMQALGEQELKRVRLLIRAYRLIGARGPVLTGVTDALLSHRTRESDPDAVAYVHECLRSADRGSLLTVIRSVSVGRPDLRPLLPAITAPTLHVTTEVDELWTPVQAQDSAALSPHGEALIAGGGHLTPLESPDETIDTVRRLWGRA